MFRLAGKFKRGDYASRVKYRRWIIWAHLVVPVCLFLFFRSPVTMVIVGGYAQALTLPILSVGTLYMRHRGLPKDIAPGRVATAGLWFAALVITAVMVYSLGLTLKNWL